MNVGAWCHVHVQFADRCADENRACEFGRQRPVSPLPDRGATRREGDPARYVSSEGVPGGWMSGPSPTTDALHLTLRLGTRWHCHCGATFDNPCQALQAEGHR